jgi:peptide/nickel transport system substrate-binding protein
MKKMKVLAAVVAVSMLAVGGVASTSQAAPKKPKPTTLTLGMFEGIKSWGVLDADWSVQTPYRQAVYDTILREAPNGSVVPNVASKFYYTGSTKTLLTLEIRPGITFTDGTPLTNKVVAANLNRYIKPANNALGRNFVDDISGAVAVAPNKVLITLKQANPGLTLYLARQVGLLTSPKNFDSPTEKSIPIGSGPYILDQARTQPGTQYYFKANPNYWNPRARKFDNFVIKVLATQPPMNTALQTGAIDGGPLLEKSAYTSLTAAGIKSTGFVSNVQAWRFSDRTGKLGSPIANLKVRQALNHAVDRKAILESPIGNGLGYVTSQEWPKGVEGYVPALENKYPYDPEKAKRLLAEAGYPNGIKISSIQPFFFYNGPNRAILAPMMEKSGVTIEWITANPPAPSAFAELQAGKHPMFYQGLQRDPNWAFLNFSVAKDALWNADKYTDPTMEKLINDFRYAKPENGKKILEQLNTHMLENALSIPLYVLEDRYMHTSKVKITKRASFLPHLLDFSPAK